MPAPLNHPPYPGCETGGRPRKYSTEDIERFADELLIWIKNEANFWLKDFCLEKGIDPNYMHEWAKENDKFRCAYKLSKAFQESRIFKGAMLDTFNTGMSKFALVNNHGWADKTETKVSGDAANPLAFLMQKADGESKDLVNEE
jgi:hypothetical protein